MMGFSHRLREHVTGIPKRLGAYLVSGALKGDLIGGLVTGSVLVPQSMSYALLANLPPEVGLYASISLVVYALLGSSPQLSVAPVAMSSLLVGMTTAPYRGTSKAIEIALTIAFLAGIVQIFLGISSIGEILSRWLSRTMLAGYTTGVALTIQMSQMPAAFGIKVPPGPYPIYNFVVFLQNLPATKPIPIGFFLISVLCLVLAQKIIKPKLNRRIRFMADFATMCIVIVGAAVAYALISGNASVDLPTVGKLPSGFRIPRLPPMSVVDGSVVTTSVVVGLMGFFEGYAVSRSLPSATNLNTRKELVAVGFANIASSVFNGFSVAGGLSRTMVSVNAGSTTQISSVIAFLVSVFAILTLSGVMRYIPNAILSAIVIVAVIGMIKYEAVYEAYKVSKIEFIVASTSAVMVVCVGPMYGLAYGVGCSIIHSMYQLATPHMAELGEMRNHLLRNLKRYPEEARRVTGILIVRLDAPLFFANSQAFFTKCKMLIDQREAKHETTQTDHDSPEVIRGLIIDASGVGWIDISAVHELLKFQNFLLARRTTLILAEVRGPVRDTLERFNRASKKQVAPFFENIPSQTSPVLHPSESQSLLVVQGSDVAAAQNQTRGVDVDEIKCFSVHSLEEALAEAKVKFSSPRREQSDASGMARGNKHLSSPSVTNEPALNRTEMEKLSLA